MKKFLKVKEVAELCGCCERTVKGFIDKGVIKSTRNYRNHRIIALQEAIKLQRILTGNTARQEDGNGER